MSHLLSGQCGIPIDWSSFGDIVTHPVSMGIAAGLLFGKLIGIAGFLACGKAWYDLTSTWRQFQAHVGRGAHGRHRLYHVHIHRELGFAHHA